MNGGTLIILLVIAALAFAIPWSKDQDARQRDEDCRRVSAVGDEFLAPRAAGVRGTTDPLADSSPVSASDLPQMIGGASDVTDSGAGGGGAW